MPGQFYFLNEKALAFLQGLSNTAFNLQPVIIQGAALPDYLNNIIIIPATTTAKKMTKAVNLPASFNSSFMLHFEQIYDTLSKEGGDFSPLSPGATLVVYIRLSITILTTAKSVPMDKASWVSAVITFSACFIFFIKSSILLPPFLYFVDCLSTL